MFENKKNNQEEQNKAIKKNQSEFIQKLYKIENWFYNRKHIELKIEDGNIRILSKKNRVNYVSLFEKNNKFKRTPKQKEKVMIKDGSVIKIIGNKSDDLTVTFYLIEYDKKKQVKVNRLFLNREKRINIDNQTESCRLAVRIEGVGELTITNFEITNDIIKQESSLKSELTPKKMKEIKVACILDEFSMESYSDNLTLIPFTPQNWKQTLSINKPDILMVESAWQGNFGSWRYEIASFNINKNHQNLKKVIQFCNENNIPTVFWNKEDPIHYEAFIDAASLFDYVFTTDANLIESYKDRLKHDKVFVLQFAANPKLHNPILIDKNKKDKISFAGSYYGNRHEERRKDMYEMLSISKSFGLDIYDRNYEVNKKGPTDFSFPQEFEENIIGTLKYSQIDKAYKGYKIILNVNSVKNSPTMFSRRVFEGLACGTPIVSSYSKGIRETFREIVIISENKEEVKQKIQELLTNPKKYRDIAMKGIREVFRYHTYRHRIAFILEKLNIPLLEEEKSLTVLFNVKSLSEYNKAIQILENQTLKDVHVIFILSEFNGYEKLLENNSSNKMNIYLIQEVLSNTIQDIVSTNYFTVLKIQHEYGECYLEDLMHAADYSDADVIGKKKLFDGNNYYYNDFEYEYVDTIINDTAIYRTEKLKNHELRDVLCDENLIKMLFAEKGAKIFSADQFNIKLL